MSAETPEYVIAPWGTDNRETEIITIELPSRNLIVQLETPADVLDSMSRLAHEHDIPVEEALAERLELNRARVSLLAAQSVDDVAQVRRHLTEARELLSGVERLDTDEIRADIDRVWHSELDAE
jgi:hypothetical protein